MTLRRYQPDFYAQLLPPDRGGNGASRANVKKSAASRAREAWCRTKLLEILAGTDPIPPVTDIARALRVSSQYLERRLRDVTQQLVARRKEEQANIRVQKRILEEERIREGIVAVEKIGLPVTVYRLRRQLGSGPWPLLRQMVAQYWRDRNQAPRDLAASVVRGVAREARRLDGA